MVPTVWRYLLAQYLKVFLLCSVSIVAVLLTTRLDDIAHFAALGAEGRAILKFIFLQIPYILPVVIPISGLIAVYLVMQRLSATHELTALRASGMPLRHFIAPILMAATFIGVGNFYIVSELATSSHYEAARLKSDLRSLNPLLLIHNKHLMKMRGMYFDALGKSRVGETASDVILAIPNSHHDKINLIVAKNLDATTDTFIGEQMTFISALPVQDDSGFDHLMVENIEKSTTFGKDLSLLFPQKGWVLHNDFLGMSMLLAKIQEEREAISHLVIKEDVKAMRKSLNRSYSEIVRRLAIACATVTFTLMGAAFSISITRRRSWKGLACVSLFTAICLTCFFAARGVDHLLLISSILYLIPQAVTIILSLWMLQRISHGVEA